MRDPPGWRCDQVDAGERRHSHAGHLHDGHERHGREIQNQPRARHA
jgi:hypothetical protein